MTDESVQNDESGDEAFRRQVSSQAGLMHRDGIVGVCRTIGLGVGMTAQWRMTEHAFADRGLRYKNLPRRAVQALMDARRGAIENAAAIWFAAYGLQKDLFAIERDEGGTADDQQAAEDAPELTPIPSLDADERAALDRLLPALSVVIWNVAGDEWLDDPHGNTPRPVRQLILEMASLGDSGHEIAQALAARQSQAVAPADGTSDA